MFRHKNLVLASIKKSIGITDKTAKLYLYNLEQRGLISYQGEIKEQNLSLSEIAEIEKKIEGLGGATRKRKKDEFMGALLWKKRNKEEKDGVYYIPRPDIWTPIPESTLQRLNEDFECSELELKLYLLCCGYRDKCVYEGKQFKNLTFETIKNNFEIKATGERPNRIIRRALLFLKSLGLIDYSERLINNRKGIPVPCFKLLEVNYYITYEIQEVNEEIEDQDLIEILKRVNDKIV
jgi:hypothetical protein